jgi:hypothetical protein
VKVSSAGRKSGMPTLVVPVIYYTYRGVKGAKGLYIDRKRYPQMGKDPRT